jgi:pyrroline-5-carboxylate reductase
MTGISTRMTDDLLLVGCGSMAGAMLDRWLATGMDPASVRIIRPSGTPSGAGVRVVRNTAQLSGEIPPAMLMLALKPQQLAAAAPDIASLIGPHTMVVSILAGVTVDALRALFPSATTIIRAMPNMPVAHGAGVIALTGVAADSMDGQRITRLMQPLGLLHWVAEDGAAFDLVTALAGCGPAFTYRFTAALAAAGARLGLDADTADALARATVMGAAGMASASSVPLGDLVRGVASPGGMTQAGLDVLDSDARLVTLLTETLRAARDRGQMLAASAIARPDAS